MWLLVRLLGDWFLVSSSGLVDHMVPCLYVINYFCLIGIIHYSAETSGENRMNCGPLGPDKVASINSIGPSGKFHL